MFSKEQKARQAGAQERTTKPRARTMAFPRLLSLSPHVIAGGYLAAYIALDWLSFLHPFGRYGITPWNPPTGVSFVLVLLFGQRHLPLLFLAPLLAEIVVRGMPAPVSVALLGAAVIAVGYSAAVVTLLHPRLRFEVSLSSMRDLFMLLVVSVTSAAVVAFGYVSLYAATGLLPWGDFAAAVMRYWVGDVIGIAVVTPCLLIIMTRGQPFAASWETLAQVASIAICLLLVFGLAESRNYQLFYLMFLPIVWIAVRSGLEGVSAGLVLTQLGLIAALQLGVTGDTDVTTYQALMLVLTLTGLAAGVLVTERRRAELQLRLQQDAQAKLTRLGSMGELATVLAHEINQPLMAAGTYTRLVAKSIACGDPPGKAGEAAVKAVAQVERAAEVVRRLRELIRFGRSELAPVAVSRLVTDTLELLRPDIERGNVRIEQRLAPGLPQVMVDALQIEQVLLNLVRNALEAIRDSNHDRGTVSILATRSDATFVEVEVRDTGPGFAPGAASAAPEPFSSTKADGLGVGLSLSRSIVEAHGGTLVTANVGNGASVRFTLPVADTGK